MSLLTTIQERWKAAEPKFFVGVQRLALAIGTPAMAIWIANSQLSLSLPAAILTACKYAIATCAGMGLTAKLTVVTPPPSQP